MTSTATSAAQTQSPSSPPTKAIPAGLTKTQVISAYRAIAPVYDAWSALTESAARRRCIELAAVKDGESILEIAVGTGALFEMLVRRNPSGRNEGIDLTDAMLDRARARMEKYAWESYALQVGDAEALPFPDETFNLVVNSYMFDLLPEEAFPTVVAEIRRVLRPGGRVVLVNMTTNHGVLGELWHKIYRAAPQLLGGCRAVELAPTLEAEGFTRIHRETLVQLGFPSEVLLGFKPEINAADRG